MALSNVQILYNAEIMRGVIARKFSFVQNKVELLTAMLQFLQAQDLSLQTYTGTYFDTIVSSMDRMIANGRYDAGRAQVAFQQLMADIKEQERRERELYTSQAREVSALDQLKQNQYVPLNHLATDAEIKKIFDHYLPGKVSYSDPMSLTQDAGRALADTLRANNKPGLHLIPVNKGNNHWALIFKQQQGDHVTVTYWDSLTQPKAGNHAPQEFEILTNVVAQVYPANKATIHSIYTGEQRDSTTCGPRVVQKTFQLANVETGLTRANPADPNTISLEYFKVLTACEPDLSAKNLEVVGGDVPYVYVAEAYQQNAKIQQLVENTKLHQESSDECLAVAIQDVYIKHPDIDSNAAMTLAKEQLAKMTSSDYQRTRNEVINWTQQYHRNKTSSAKIFKSCKQEAAAAAVDCEDRSASRTVLA